LVWTSDGALKGGHPIRYRGTSILEVEGDKVRRFETIYDSAAFVRPETTGRRRRLTKRPSPNCHPAVPGCYISPPSGGGPLIRGANR
jgi:hypothetical protein